jgi:hypothetical protein
MVLKVQSIRHLVSIVTFYSFFDIFFMLLRTISICSFSHNHYRPYSSNHESFHLYCTAARWNMSAILSWYAITISLLSSLFISLIQHRLIGICPASEPNFWCLTYPQIAIIWWDSFLEWSCPELKIKLECRFPSLYFPYLLVVELDLALISLGGSKW